MRGVDVLVVGAGPAGLMAGLTLSRAGVSVVILEKRERPDLPVACGEAVSRWFFERFNFSPRSSWVKATVSRLEMVMPGGGMFYAPYPGYSLDRRAFEAHLVAEYQEAGGILNRGDSFLDASRKGKGWEVTTSQGKWKVAVLLGCDGPRSRVASYWDGGGVSGCWPFSTSFPSILTPGMPCDSTTPATSPGVTSISFLGVMK